MTPQEIIQIGQQIAGETTEGGNTAERVGGVIEGIGLRLQAILTEIDNLPSVGDDEISSTSTNFVKNLVIYSALQSLKSEINGTTSARIEALQTTVSGWISSLRSTLEDEIANAVPGMQALVSQLTTLKNELTPLKTALETLVSDTQNVNRMLVQNEAQRQENFANLKVEMHNTVSNEIARMEQLIGDISDILDDINGETLDEGYWSPTPDPELVDDEQGDN